MIELLLILLCVALNGALSALEMAFVSTSRVDLASDARPSDSRVPLLLRLRQTPERTLSVIQIGITLVGIVSGAIGGAGAQRFLGPQLVRLFGLSAGVAQAAALGMVAVPLVFVTVVFGELVPKVFALRHPRPIALAGASWLRVMERLLLPLVRLLSWVTRAVVSVMPAPAGGPPAPTYALNLFDLGRRLVRDAMLPWSATTRADASMPSQAVAQLAMSSGHTRLPVVRDGAVLGLLHTKELMRFLAAGEHDWHLLIRPAVMVGTGDGLLTVLRLLQGRHSHMAVVTDADGTIVGVITLEDILEEVLGDLYDEDDDQAVVRLLASRGKAGRAAAHGPL